MYTSGEQQSRRRTDPIMSFRRTRGSLSRAKLLHALDTRSSKTTVAIKYHPDKTQVVTSNPVVQFA